MEKIRLQDGFEPVWLEDFEIMRQIGMRSWALLLYMALTCDHKTRLCKLSELKVRRELGWDTKNTRRLFKNLIEHGYIEPTGYLTYLVKSWRRLSTTSGIMPEPKKKIPRAKSPTTSGKKPELPRAKSPTTSGKKPDPIYTESELQNQNTAVNNLGGEKNILKTVGKEYGHGSPK